MQILLWNSAGDTYFKCLNVRHALDFPIWDFSQLTQYFQTIQHRQMATFGPSNTQYFDKLALLDLKTNHFKVMVEINHLSKVFSLKYKCFHKENSNLFCFCYDDFYISWQPEPSMDRQSELKSKPKIPTFSSKKVYCHLVPAEMTMIFGIFTKKSTKWDISHLCVWLCSKDKFVKFCYWFLLSGVKTYFFKIKFSSNFPLKCPKLRSD